MGERNSPSSTSAPTNERRVRTTQEWLAYFQQNAVRHRPIPWQSTDMGASPAEMAPIRRSLQAWQLGETSDGRHLAASAARYAATIGDPAYRDVIDLFIWEEQRHGALLGRILDDAGIPRRQADWGDTLFRRLRHSITDIEVWTTPVVMVETLAMIYYNAIRRATGSPVLRAVCAQILADEVPHVQLQCERLAVLLRNRSRTRFHLTMLAHRALFLVVMLLVWAGHHRALRAGGFTWPHYRRAAYAKMRRAWQRMDPQRYVWT
ncbi:ferritin-like domain-containing protein [Nocardia sp. NPDC058640]|uniref:ferritin-like domain-containing protein n=1 Tax=Nocardia sp. NPDC058640 TaxID=3346571 RepID=UPI003665D379